jgi:hypothetical protein
MDKMSRPNQNLKSNQDDRLAEFTDEVLEGRMQQPASNADEELFLLEETILRLKNAYPPVSLDESRVKQMHVRLKNRLRRETQDDEQPFWKKWLARPQVRLAAGVLGLLLVFVLASLLLTKAGSSTTATALTSAQGKFVAAGLVVVMMLFLWIKRRR